MCRLICVASILFSGADLVTFAAGEQDELNLLQAQATAKSRSPEVATTSEHAPLCVDDEELREFSTPIRNPELLEAPAIHESLVQAHVQASQLELDPVLVLLVRQMLWLASLVFVADAVVRWRGQEAKSSEKPAAVSRRSQLQKAAFAGDEALCVQLLDEAGILYGGGPCEALVATDSWGTTAMHAAAIGGAHVVTELFLEHGAPVDPVNACDETPLHLAARGGHMELCRLLVKRGASLHAVNAEDETPLVVACDAGRATVCQALVALGGGVGSEVLPQEELLQEIVEDASLEQGSN